MFVAANSEDPRLFINSMREYVLNPIRTAVAVASTDRSEILAERDAFVKFTRRVRELDPKAPTPRQQIPISGTESQSDRVREIYKETVLAVDHYDIVYDESLCENAVAELGTNAAKVLVSDTGVKFTPVAKELLINKAQQGLEKRRNVAADIAAEQESLAANREVIRNLVEGLTGTVVPEWYQEEFDTEITAVLCQRQDHLHRRHNNADGHELCNYLYRDQCWSYPILTSIARLCETTLTSSQD